MSPFCIPGTASSDPSVAQPPSARRSPTQICKGTADVKPGTPSISPGASLFSRKTWNLPKQKTISSSGSSMINPRAISPIDILLKAANLTIAEVRTPPQGKFTWPWNSPEEFLGHFRMARRHAEWSQEEEVEGDLEYPAVELLIRQLWHPNESIRENAATALEAYQPPALQAIPSLIEVLEDENQQVAAAAARALAQMASEAVPRLMEKLQLVRSWALNLLKFIEKIEEKSSR
jgi:hypothetical protein